MTKEQHSLSKNVFSTRASSINRALDQVGDKWSLLILQEVFWGIHSFTEMMETLGVSRGVLADRLKWLQEVDCLTRTGEHGKRPRYRLTEKSLQLYDCALMAIVWERRFHSTPELDRVDLIHRGCGKAFNPEMHCASCDGNINAWETSYHQGPGAMRDNRQKKVRRRSSIPMENVPSRRSLYRNLIDIVGDRWTANIIALAFLNFTRFDEFHRELPVATNILADRLKFLVERGIFSQHEYQRSPPRSEYRLTEKGMATYPWFLALLQWGDDWCDTSGKGKPLLLTHNLCDKPLRGEVRCDQCQGRVLPREVAFHLDGPPRR